MAQPQNKPAISRLNQTAREMERILTNWVNAQAAAEPEKK